jgi:hypothetical protein
MSFGNFFPTQKDEEAFLCGALRSQAPARLSPLENLVCLPLRSWVGIDTLCDYDAILGWTLIHLAVVDPLFLSKKTYESTSPWFLGSELVC